MKNPASSTIKVNNYDISAKQIQLCSAGDIDVIVDNQYSPPKAWLNSCPHTGAPLAMTADELLNADNRYECCLHGALFDRASGLCIDGPCINQYLEAVEASLQDDELHIRLTNT